MKRPFLIVALLFLAGILLGEFVHPPLSGLFAVGILAGLTGILWAKARLHALCVALVVAGWADMAYRTSVISPVDIRLLLRDEPQEVQLRGTLCSPPSERITDRDQQERWRSTAVVEVEALHRGTNWEPAFGKVTVSTSGLLGANFFEGQHVQISGVIRPPRPPLAPGLFDAKAFYERKGIYYQLQASTNDWQLVEDGTLRHPPLSTRFHDWAKKTLALGLPIEDQALRLTWTLMLDWKAPMTESVETPFVLAGTYHIFAVDGLRISLISGILILFLRVLRIPRSVSGCIAIPAIWFYAGLTGFPASAIRATIMMTVIIVGWTLRRPGNLLNSLFAAAFLILVWDPQQLFQAGFQLSFLVVLCMALLLPSMEQLFKKITEKDPYIPDAARKQPPEWLRGIGHFCYETCAVSIAAWLGSLPLAAHYFHVFNPVSIPANIAVVPLTVLALASSMGSLLVGAWWPFGAELFNHGTWFWMSCITDISQGCAKWPGAYWYVSSPSAATFTAYYALLLALMTGWIFRPSYRRWRVAGVLGIVLVWGCQTVADHRVSRLHLLPLNGGHAVFIDAPGTPNDLLVDCGHQRPFDDVTQPFLQAQGVNSLPTFCMTHASVRQMGGAMMLHSNFPINVMAVSPVRGRSSAYRQICGKLEGRLQVVKAGDKLGEWSVLHPSGSDRGTTADDNAVVLIGSINQKTVLLLSELSRAGQNALLNNHPGLHADIVIAGLPTRDEPACDWLLETVKPELLVIADSEYPAQRRATAKTRERLAKGITPVVFCRDVGALTFEFTSEGWDVKTTQRVSVKGGVPLPKPAHDAAPSSDEDPDENRD